MLRLLGALSVFMAFIVVMALVVIVGAMVDPPTGWEGLIVGIAVMLGGGAAVLGSGLLWLANAGARDPNATNFRYGISAITVLGATFWAPIAWQGHVAPIDRYLAVLRLGLLLIGAVTLWRLSRSQSRPA